MEEKEIFERDMEENLSFIDRYRSLILALIFSVPVISLFLYPLIFQDTGNRYFMDTFAFVFLFAALALTLNLEIGYLGLPNFGKVAFVMIGSYSYAIVGVYEVNLLGIGVVLTGIIVATVVCGFAGVILTLPTLRLREDYFAIVTIVAGEILRLIANNETGLGGPSGFAVINFVFLEFDPDTFMKGANLLFLDFVIILWLAIFAFGLYRYLVGQYREIYGDSYKSVSYAMQRTINLTAILGIIVIFLNFKTVYHDFASFSLDLFVIALLVMLFLVKFTLQFFEEANFDLVITASIGIYLIVALVDVILGGGDPGNTEVNNVNWYFMISAGVVMLIVFVVMELFYHSPFGRALRAVREDDTSARSIGKSLFGLRLRGLIISNALTGFVGAFYAMILATVSPQAFLPLLTFLLYIMVIIGGTGNNKGVIFGAVVVQLLIQTTRRLSDIEFYYPFFTPTDYLGWNAQVNPFNIALIIVGVVLVIFLIYAPEGIFPEKRDNNDAYRDLLYLAEEDVGKVEENPILGIMAKMTGTDIEKLYSEEGDY